MRLSASPLLFLLAVLLFSIPAKSRPLHTSPALEWSVAAGSVLVGVFLPLALDEDQVDAASPASGEQPSLSLDARSIAPPSPRAKTGSDITLGLSLALGAGALAHSRNAQEFHENALLTSLSLSSTLLVTQTLKVAVQRNRPFRYLHNANEIYPENRDAILSFPSGHTSLAFASGASSATLLALRGKTALAGFYGGASFGLGMTTALLRVEATKHFPTDVIAGAILGVGLGVLIPWAHSLERRGPESRQDGVTLPLFAYGTGW